jgi:hypothetical protein
MTDWAGATSRRKAWLSRAPITPPQGSRRKTKHRGIAAVAADFLLNLIAYNLIRIPKLVTA